MRKTKIVATIGPSTSSYESMRAILDAGVNVVRFNFSHASYEGTDAQLAHIDRLRSEGYTVSTLLDTKGPEIRTGDLAEKRSFATGDLVRFYTDAATMPMEPDTLFCDYPYLAEDIAIGGLIRVDSGLLDLEVMEKHADHVVAKCRNGAVIGSRRHVNLPGVRLRLPGVTDKDRADLEYAVARGMDYVAPSFIRSRANVEEVRAIVGGIKIIPKIENEEGVENLAEILDAADGAMVARGDLGIEVPIELMPSLQREMVKICRTLGKPVIVATHMLESMIENPFPTRAEVSDVYNAVWQKADATMLSGESAMGKYPVEAVAMMARVIESAEREIEYDHDEFDCGTLDANGIKQRAIVRAAVETADHTDAAAIVVLSRSGFLARIAGAYRPRVPVHAFVPTLEVAGRLGLCFGVRAHVLPELGQAPDDAFLASAVSSLRLPAGANVVVVAGSTREGKMVPSVRIISA
jgi:pyruvate kinase